MNREFIARHWYAYIYERQEDYTQDVELLLRVLDEQSGASLNILEVACGGGRIAVPLARAGHRVTGFDADEHMLMRCYVRADDLGNLRVFKADAVLDDWGEGYDAVILGANFLINIESGEDYAKAQETVVLKAGAALVPGGFLFMDFDMHYDPAAVFNKLEEYSYFQGTDDFGTYGCMFGYGSVYNPVTRVCTGSNHMEITTKGGESFIVPRQWHKHIPTQGQVWDWLGAAGLAVERTYRNFTDEPVPIPIDEGIFRITLVARKV